MEISSATSGGRSDTLVVLEDDGSWKLDVKEFRLPQQSSTTGDDDDSGRRRFALGRLCAPGKKYKVEEYYKQQERLLEGFSEMETMTAEGCSPGLTEILTVPAVPLTMSAGLLFGTAVGWFYSRRYKRHVILHVVDKVTCDFSFCQWG